MAYLIILRLIHIACGTFWAGVSIYLATFILPASKGAGPAGGRFMQQLSQTNKLPLVMFLIPTLSVLSGILLIWKLSNGLQTSWVESDHGMILIVGGSLAIIAYLTGFIMSRPAIMGISSIGKEMAGNPPNEAQAAELARLRKKLTTGTNIVAILLTGAVIAMSIVRYY